MLIVFAIFDIHAIAYDKIMIWLSRPRRFPFGVWFESDHYEKNILNSSNDVLKIEVIQHLIIDMKIKYSGEKKLFLMFFTLFMI